MWSHVTHALHIPNTEGPKEGPLALALAPIADPARRRPCKMQVGSLLGSASSRATLWTERRFGSVPLFWRSPYLAYARESPHQSSHCIPRLSWNPEATALPRSTPAPTSDAHVHVSSGFWLAWLAQASRATGARSLALKVRGACGACGAYVPDECGACEACRAEAKTARSHRPPSQLSTAPSRNCGECRVGVGFFAVGVVGTITGV